MINKVSIALLHYPVLDKEGELYTTAITNMDVHDIARTSCTYELEKYYVISPIEAQRQMAQTIKDFWTDGSGVNRNQDRSNALEKVCVEESIEKVVESLKNKYEDLLIIATSAKVTQNKTITFHEIKDEILKHKHTLILFGTGYGLAPSVLDAADYVLEPVYGLGNYNHLSVRSAVAIIIDRILSR